MKSPEADQTPNLLDRAYSMGSTAIDSLNEFAKSITSNRAIDILATGAVAVGGAAFGIGETASAYADGASGATGPTEQSTINSNPLLGDIDTGSPSPDCPSGNPGGVPYWCRQWDSDFQVSQCQEETTQFQKGSVYFIAQRRATVHIDSDQVKVNLKLRQPLLQSGDSNEECAEVTDNSVELQLALVKHHSGHLVLKDLQPLGKVTSPIFGNNSVVYDGKPNQLTAKLAVLKVNNRSEKTAMKDHELYTIYTVNSEPLIQEPYVGIVISIPGPMLDIREETFSKVTVRN